MQLCKCRDQLQKAEQRWRRRWAQEAFVTWRASAAALRARSCLLLRGQARRAARLLQAAMSAWMQHTAYIRKLSHAEVGHCCDVRLYGSHFQEASLPKPLQDHKH